MTFTYTLTCTLDTTTALPPVAGSEEQRAYWVTPTILAWPLSLLPRGMDREVVVTDAGDPLPGSGLALRLITAPDGGAAAIHGRILGRRSRRCASSGTFPTRSSPRTPTWRAASP